MRWRSVGENQSLEKVRSKIIEVTSESKIKTEYTWWKMSHLEDTDAGESKSTVVVLADVLRKLKAKARDFEMF